MREMGDVLLSLRPQYVARLLSGEKSIEIRNRAVRISPGYRLWIYSTLPRGCIEAVAVVSKVEVGSPSAIWKRCKKQMALSLSAFQQYVNGADKISAIFIDRVCGLPFQLTLSYLRSRIPGFRPPQSMKFLCDSDIVLKLISSHLLMTKGPGHLRDLDLVDAVAWQISAKSV
jgi:predicted transcriptional regulator